LTTSKRLAIAGVSADAMPITPTAAAAHASTDSGFGLFRSTRPGYNLYMQVPRWVTISLSLTAIGLVPWTLWLTFSLPSKHVTDHYDLAWVGFDIGLAAAFAATALAAYRASNWLVPSAAVTGTMLLCDAWFDVVTSGRGGERLEAVLEAVFAELPLAALCGVIVYDAELAHAWVRRLRRR
jgi:hypothetical protein